MAPRTHVAALVGCAFVASGLCAWGAVGWHRAYQAELEKDRLWSAQQLRDRAYLEAIVRAGETAARLSLEGAPSPYLDAGPE